MKLFVAIFALWSSYAFIPSLQAQEANAVITVDSTATGGKLVPLPDYMLSNDPEDLAIAEYVLTRCSALYITVAEIVSVKASLNDLADQILVKALRAYNQVLDLKKKLMLY